MHVMCFYRFSSARQALRFVPSKRRQALPSIDCSSNVCARSSIIPKFEPWFIDLIRCIPSWISVKLLMVKFSFLPRSEDNFVVQYFIHTYLIDSLNYVFNLVLFVLVFDECQDHMKFEIVRSLNWSYSALCVAHNFWNNFIIHFINPGRFETHEFYRK